MSWCNIDLEGASLRVERSLEETKAGLRFKPPKTAHGRRTITLPLVLVFCQPDGSPIVPSRLLKYREE